MTAPVAPIRVWRRIALACTLAVTVGAVAPDAAFAWPFSRVTQLRHSAPLRVNRAVSDLYASTMNAMWFGDSGSACRAFIACGDRALVRAVRDGTEMGNGTRYPYPPRTCAEAAADIFQSVRRESQYNWTYRDWHGFIVRDVRGAVVTAVVMRRAPMIVPAELEQGEQTLLRTRRGWLCSTSDPRGQVGPVIFDETAQLV